MRSLAKTCLRLASKNLRANPRQSIVHIAILALSVAAYNGIRSSATAFSAELDRRQHISLGADLSIESRTNLDPSQYAALERLTTSAGLWTLATLTVFDAVADSVPDPVPAVLKAVDPSAYPLYGSISLDPPQPLARALQGDSIVISSDLLQQLALVRAQIGVNGLPCRIAAVIAFEPDRRHGSLQSPVRAIVSRETLEKSGLLRSGVPALQRILLRFPPGVLSAPLRTEIERAFPDAGIFSPSESEPTLEAITGTAENFFGIVGWFALTLGAAGVILITGIYVESRFDILAAVKCVGATPRHALLWFSCELLLLGVFGGAVGAALGEAARYILCSMAGVTPGAPAPWFILEGALLGPSLSLLSGIASTVTTSRLRPLELLRRNVDPWRTSWKRRIGDILAWLALGLIGGFIAGVPKVAALVLAILAVLLAALYSAARAIVALLRSARIRSHPAFRMGLKNLSAAGSNSSVILALLALIAALGVAAAAGEQIVWNEVLSTEPLLRANLYLLGFQDTDLDGVLAILNRHHQQPLELFTLSWMRIASPNSPVDSPVDSPMMIVGCSAGQNGAVVEQRLARRLHVQVGSALDFEQSEKKLHIAVSGISNLSPAQQIWFSITFPCAAFDGFGIFHHAGIVVGAAEKEPLIKDLRRAYPDLDIETRESLYELVHSGARNVMALIRFLAASTLLGAATLFAALIASAAAQRAKEIAILKVIGASPRWVVRMLCWEFAVLGGLAALLGSALGILLIDAILSALFFKTLLNPHLAILGWSTLSGAFLGEVAGLIACARLPWIRPLEALRD